MKIEIGKVLKAQGIKGEIKVSCFLDNPAMLKNVKTFYLEKEKKERKAFRTDGKFFFLVLYGVVDRNGAELLRDLSVYVEKEDLKLADDTFFIEDVIGCFVYLDNGVFVGNVTEVEQYGTADVYDVEKDGKYLAFPFLKDLVVSVDVVNKKIVLNATRFEQVVVYQDED